MSDHPCRSSRPGWLSLSCFLPFPVYLALLLFFSPSIFPSAHPSFTFCFKCQLEHYWDLARPRDQQTNGIEGSVPHSSKRRGHATPEGTPPQGYTRVIRRHGEDGRNKRKITRCDSVRGNGQGRLRLAGLNHSNRHRGCSWLADTWLWVG